MVCSYVKYYYIKDPQFDYSWTDYTTIGHPGKMMHVVIFTGTVYRKGGQNIRIRPFLVFSHFLSNS